MNIDEANQIIGVWLGKLAFDIADVENKLIEMGWTIQTTQSARGVEVILSRGGRGQIHSGESYEPVFVELAARMIEAGYIPALPREVADAGEVQIHQESENLRGTEEAGVLEIESGGDLEQHKAASKAKKVK
jgi:hypothetical protein